jgi:hypothetical protein
MGIFLALLPTLTCETKNETMPLNQKFTSLFYKLTYRLNAATQ